MRGSLLADLGRLRHRNANHQNRAGAVAAVTRSDTAALCLDEAAADRQSEPGPGATPILCLNAVKFVKDAFEVGGGNARPLVDDFDADGPVLTASVYADRAAGRRVFGGVVEQVEQHLLEEDRVDA